MLGNRINELRKSFGWNQVELANKLGVTKQTISNWENENILPSIDILIRVSKLFNVTTDYLLGLDNALQLNVEGLPINVISHLSQLIDDYREIS